MLHRYDQHMIFRSTLRNRFYVGNRQVGSIPRANHRNFGRSSPFVLPTVPAAVKGLFGACKIVDRELSFERIVPHLLFGVSMGFFVLLVEVAAESSIGDDVGCQLGVRVFGPAGAGAEFFLTNKVRERSGIVIARVANDGAGVGERASYSSLPFSLRLLPVLRR